MSGAHCLGEHYGRYSSVKEAVLACSIDPECGAVYDQQCDGRLPLPLTATTAAAAAAAAAAPATAPDIYLCPKRQSYEYEREGFEYTAPLHAASHRGSCLYFRPPTRQNMDCTTPPNGVSLARLVNSAS